MIGKASASSIWRAAAAFTAWLLALSACSESPERGSAAEAQNDASVCTSGDTRCQGPTGYQQCTPDGIWGPPQSCAGYGNSNHCLEISPEYAACVEPACWYWNVAGLLDNDDRVGVCLPDGGFQACNAGGTLDRTAECAGVCVTVTVINDSNVGFCRAECVDGEQECLGGSLYRQCQGGRWERVARSCEDGSSCQPLADTALPQIQCGSCTPGTSRCVAGQSAIETCGESGQFEEPVECGRGVCQSKGVQAYCAPACTVGAPDCAFDGAPAAKSCVEPGEWSVEEACATDTSCRTSGGTALGCVECVGPAAPGGNAWGVADSRCNGDEIMDCGDDNRWQPGTACPAGETCVELKSGPSSLAYCTP